jgi:hypothetical protein
MLNQFPMPDDDMQATGSIVDVWSFAFDKHSNILENTNTHFHICTLSRASALIFAEWRRCWTGTKRE